MSCILRAWGEAFDVAMFLESSPLQSDGIYDKPRTVVPEESEPRPAGFNLRISSGSDPNEIDELARQIEAALMFLDQYEDELRRLGSFPGVEGVSLEFGIPWRGAFAQTETFPSDLLWRAGALDITLQITHYTSELPTKPLD